MKNERRLNVNWGAIYRVLNIAIIVLIFIRIITQAPLGLYVILGLAALLIIGLLDSLDNNRLRENMSRHLFDFVLLVLFFFMYNF